MQQKEKRPGYEPGRSSRSCSRSSVDPGQSGKLVEWWRAGQRPLKRGRALAPRIVRRLLAAEIRPEQVDEEQRHPGDGDHVAVGRDLVPSLERRSVVRHSPRHGVEAEEMLWEED